MAERLRRDRADHATTDLYAALGEAATGARPRSTSPPDRDRVARALRRETQRRAAPVDLLAVLPRRGLRRRQPVAVHRRRAAARSRSTSSPPSRSTRRATRSSSTASCTRSSSVGDGSIAGGLRGHPAELTWGFRKIFDRLDTMADDLRARPVQAASSRPRSRCTTSLVEATLAQPGQHFIDALPGASTTCCPASACGMRNVVARRAAPHRLRREAALRPLPRGPGVQRTPSRTLLRDVLPETVAVFVPPNWDLDYVTALRLRARGHLRGGHRVARDASCAPPGIPLDELPACRSRST